MRKNTLIQKLIFIVLILPFFTVSSNPMSQQDAEIAVEKVSGEIYCLYVGSVNVTVLKGTDGLVVVDSSYTRTSNQLLEEIAKMGPQKIQYLLITHYHGDHTGGNAIVGKDAQIISHINCQKTMVSNLKPVEAKGGHRDSPKDF